jgi:hypothetical protein
MKSIVISVLMLSMPLLFISCENESQPTQNTSDSETQSLSKKGGKLKPELIIFKEGDLEGNQTVFGCCPNRGPFPEYTMILSSTFGAISGTYDGEIFMNKVGTRKNQSYMVQFWTETIFLEVRGGLIQNDKKTKTLTATFTDAPCKIWINDFLTAPVTVSFTLTRGPAPQ